MTSQHSSKIQRDKGKRKMSNKLRSLVAFLFVFSLGLCFASRALHAQTTSEDVALYLEMKRAEYNDVEAKLKKGGLTGQSQAIFSLLKEKRAFEDNDVVGTTLAEKSEVRDALTRTAAQHLASVGFGPSDIRALEKRGVDVLVSATRIVSGTAKFQDMFLLSEHPLMVTIEDVQASDTPLVSLVTLRIDQKLKGIDKLMPPSTLQIEYPAYGTQLTKAQKCVFFFSSTRSRIRINSKNDVRGIDLVQQYLPYCMSGDIFRSIDPNGSYADESVSAVEIKALSQKFSQ